MADLDQNSSRIQLQHFENSYPDEGDFTLVYDVTESKQKFANVLNIDFWHQFHDILDNTIHNKSLKEDWNDLRVNGYCTNKRCCCGTCCRDCCGAECCRGCCTMRCCRFCCCPGECECGYGSCKGCLSHRDYYLGAVVLVIFGVFQMIAYLSFLLIIFGAVMIENYRYNNEIKDEWRTKIIQILAQELGVLAQRYNIQFTIDKYGIFGVVIDMKIVNGQTVTVGQQSQQQQQQTVMLVVQQPQQIQPQPQPMYVQSDNGPPGYQPVEKVSEGGVTVQ
eukprot:333338_1